MRRALLITLIISCNTFLEAQNWAAAGSVWHFNYSNLTFDGYIKIEKIGDTLISGKICDILKKTRIGYNYISSSDDTIYLGREYTRLSNDTVYNFRNNQFFILYCFNAVPGDTWLVAGNNTNCNLTDSIKVDSIGTTVISSTTLRYIWTSPSINIGLQFTGKVVEKIGCIGYMFPEPFCLTDLNEGGPFRCYSDSSLWSFQTGIVPYCDFTNQIAEQSLTNRIGLVYPNPFSKSTTIFLPNQKKNSKAVLKIFNALGTQVAEYSNFRNEQLIEGDFLSDGIYLWIIYNNNNEIISSGKIIKNSQLNLIP